jgi:hypothetical protein
MGWIKTHYPNQWLESTVAAHLYGCTVNNPKAYQHHRSAPKFLYAHGNGRYELYDPERHGSYQDGVPEGEDLPPFEETNGGAAEVSLSLERDMEAFLVQNLSQVEKGLTLYEFKGKSGRQLDTPAGVIDLLCLDVNGQLAVIELKAGLARDSALGQICGYMGWVAEEIGKGGRVRGILIAQDFSDRVKYGARSAGLALLRYRVNFSFEPASSLSI